MNRLMATGVVALMLAFAVLYSWFRLGSEFGAQDHPVGRVIEESPKHLVTPQMTEASKSMVLRQAPDFQCRGTDGADYALGMSLGLLLAGSSVEVQKAKSKARPATTKYLMGGNHPAALQSAGRPAQGRRTRQ